MNGKLIVIDGLDGSGKQTQTRLLAGKLERDGAPVRAISFPNYEEPSSALVKEYLSGRYGQADEVSAYAASSFYAVDRYASYTCFWKKDYLCGHTILADRYTTSNMVHQLSKLPREEWENFVAWLEDFEYRKLGLPRPDAVIYLDMHPDVSRTLLEGRYQENGGKKDIHEADLAYMARCRESALYTAGKYGWHLVRCSDEHRPFPVEAIAGDIYKIFRNLK